MTLEELKDEIETVLDSLSDDSLLSIWNEYCEDVRYYDDRIYYYEDLDDFCYGMKPTEVLERFGDLAYCDYWREGVYGVEAIQSRIYDAIDIGDLIDYMVNECESYSNDEIDELLYDFENQEDDEDDDE